MAEYEVKVVGAAPPPKPDGPLRRLGRRTGALALSALHRPRRMIALGLIGFVLIAGTPHVGGRYECRHPMHGPGTCKSVAWCAYHGIQGRRIEVPPDGAQCSLITVLPIQWGKITGQR